MLCYPLLALPAADKQGQANRCISPMDALPGQDIGRALGGLLPTHAMLAQLTEAVGHVAPGAHASIACRPCLCAANQGVSPMSLLLHNTQKELSWN